MYVVVTRESLKQYEYKAKSLITHVFLCRVSDSNSSLSDSYTSMKDHFSIINVYLQEQFRR